jgi:hypothetical protein
MEMRQAEGRHKKSLDVILLLNLNETECDRSEDDFYLGVPLRVCKSSLVPRCGIFAAISHAGNH